MDFSGSPISVGEIRRITWIGMIVNILLSILKFAVGFLGSSKAVIADAVHSLSDLATDFAVLFGVKYWTAPPDEDHPYGHQRIEALITASIGLALGMVAFGLAWDSVKTIRETHLSQTGWIAVLGPALSIVVKEILYRATVAVGKRAKSAAVAANAWHHRSDALSSIPALIAVVAATIHPGLAYADHVGALVVSLFIVKAAWSIMKPAIQELADRGASTRSRAFIESIAGEVPGVLEVHAVRTRRFSSYIYVDLHVLVDPNATIRAGHDIAQRVEEELIRRGPEVLDVVVHIEPYET